jgi:hypothetical protein
MGLNSAKRRRLVPPARKGWGTDTLHILNEHEEKQEKFREELISINKEVLEIQRKGLDRVTNSVPERTLTGFDTHTRARLGLSCLIQKQQFNQ